VDVILGIGYALAVFFAMRWIWARRAAATTHADPIAATSPSPSPEGARS
jgi:hypothetical protein